MVEDGGGTAFPVGSRVMFTGPYGVSENGAYSEWLAVRKENLCLIPDNMNDVSAAGVPRCVSDRSNDTELCGICEGQDGAGACNWRVGRKRSHSVGESAGAKHAISTTTNHAKAQQARYLASTK